MSDAVGLTRRTAIRRRGGGEERHMRSLVRGALALTCLVAALAASPAQAQNYPNRPIHFIVGFAAGGPNDIVARILGDYLSNAMGQQWVIENRAGSGGMIAAGYVANAAPDGYTV